MRYNLNMYNTENILNVFKTFVEKSAAVMQAPQTGLTTGESTERAGQTSTAPTAGQPMVRVNETNAISTQATPQLSQPITKVPTSNAAPKKINFNSFK
jgi:hypothetical protein